MPLIDARLEALRARAQREIDEGVLPSCSLAVGLGGEVVWTESFGDATTDTRYVMFSCTKAIVGATVWQLIGEGRLSLADTVAAHFPEFAPNGKDAITVEQVMTHTSGFPYAPLAPEAWSDRAARIERMASWRTNWEPGTAFEYHPTSAHWVLAELIERLDGRDFRSAIAARICEPLGLQRLALGVPEADQGDIAELVDVGSFPTPEELREVFGVDTYDLGEVTPEALLMLNRPELRAAGLPGGGGVTNAADLAAFYQALLHNPGGLWDPQVLAEGTGVVRNRFPDPMLGHPANRTAGLVVAGDDGLSFMRGMGRTVGPRTFGHNGAGGQIAWADPDTGLSFVYLTNGIDRHIIRESRRVTAIASLAGLLTTP